MYERLYITVPASLLLWWCAIVAVSLALHHEIVRQMQGNDDITIHLITLEAPSTAPAKAEAPKPLPVPKKQEDAIAKKKPLEQAAPKPKARQQHWQEAKSNNHGATITYQPMPKIPEDLRKEAFSTVAVARFHVAPDGSARVELTVPSQNPRLNRLLMDALRTWRFNPATDDGKPVASTFDIRVRFAVQ